MFLLQEIRICGHGPEMPLRNITNVGAFEDPVVHCVVCLLLLAAVGLWLQELSNSASR